MAIELPRSLVEFILLGPEDDRRQLQDSPILGDVWVAFAKAPNAQLELLITPYKENAAGMVATLLAGCFGGETAKGARAPKGRSKRKADGRKRPDVAFLQGIVAARLSFSDLVRFVVPMTKWWSEKRIAGAIEDYLAHPGTMKKDLDRILGAYEAWPRTDGTVTMQDIPTHTRYFALAGLLLWAARQGKRESVSPAPSNLVKRLRNPGTQEDIIQGLREERAQLSFPQGKDTALVWHVSRNRPAIAALSKSVPAVKADSARSLFTVKCNEIVWAIIDSGIDATHDAFKNEKGDVRVRKSFDFTRIRDIVSLDNADAATAQQRIGDLLHPHLMTPPTSKDALKNLARLAEDASQGRSINWELIEGLIEIDPRTRPPSNHGTHVAGILAANWKGRPPNTPEPVRAPDDDLADGMCPDIYLYDFRVLAPTLQETEFAIIAALQYIRYINERNSYMSIHGANLSLSIRHDVRNYACGRTPVCNECERLVNSGVVVVAAAGNRGYQNFETTEGLYESYAAFSVTDPGNAEGVITVGATHRFWPHTYGVSFFSSRGPTGDGRMKPDLVAPGERIRAPLPGGAWGDLDGTSMAAPHVSGAAAMLMGRYAEFIGQPRRIKQILCDSATDLGREKSFQGRGMLDVLRAFQTI